MWRRKLTDDEEVWRKISNADAFDAFYRESAPRLRAFLRRIVGADDENVQYRAAQLKTLMTPPNETVKETCKMVPVAGTGTVRQECTTGPTK